MSRRWILASLACLALSACKTRGLECLIFSGPDLHPSLSAQGVKDLPLHVPHRLLRENPQLSTEPEFVQAVARGGTQGRFDSAGVRAALYGVFRGETEVGLYGMEAATAADADRIEGRLRRIWAKNASLERARVHRGGNILVVVWNDRFSPSCWEAVNSSVAARLPRR